MPVEYNWVPDYEDPARMKREGRRGEFFFFVSYRKYSWLFSCFYSSFSFLLCKGIMEM